MVVRSTSQPGGRLLLGLGFSGLQEQQHRELATVDADGPQLFAVQFFQVEQGALQQIGQPLAELRPQFSFSSHGVQFTAMLIVSSTDDQ